VAEGIEDADQLRALQRLGCDFGQGYLFARPLPVAQAGELLRGDRRITVAGAPGLRLVRAV
jgi:EAL domain-containing protein (putative c-di-GMP-specific phosphodiesterase class I)